MKRLIVSGIAAFLLIVIVACNGADAAGQWRLTKSLFEAKHSLAATELDNKIYALGGRGQRGSAEAFDVYDPKIRVWGRAGAVPPFSISNHAMASLSGTLYVTGGRGPAVRAESAGFSSSEGTNSWLFDPRSKTWEPRQAMPEGRLNHAMHGVQGRLYVLAGEGAAGLIDETWVYDPAIDAWSVGAPIPTPRTRAASVTYNGRIYVFGGRDASRMPVDTIETYDPKTDSWSGSGQMPSPRYDHAAVVVGSSVHIIGGNDKTSFERHDVLDLETGEWSSLPGLSPGRGGMGAAAIGRDIYVVGGGANIGTPEESGFSLVEVFSVGPDE